MQLVAGSRRKAMLANFIRLGVEAQASAPSAEAAPTTSNDAAAAAAVANGDAAKEKN